MNFKSFNKLIFTHLKPDIWQYKVASALRKKGIRIVSISILSFNKKMFKEAFNEIICLDLLNLKPKTILNKFIKEPLFFFKFLNKIRKIKADAAIIQGPPLYLTSFFIRLFKGKFPRIFFSYDILSVIYKNPKKNMTKEQIWGEKYSFKNCDAILDKNFILELKYLPISWKINKKPSIEFLGYPLKEWFVKYNPKKKLSYKNNEIHIVYPATIQFDNPNIIILPYVREILKQKIHMHMYSVDRLNKKDMANIIQNKKELKPYLHVKKYVSPEKLSKKMSKYDFGFFFSDYQGDTRHDSIKYAYGTKIDSYLETLIPVIINKKFESINKNVAKNYSGIILEDIKDLKKSIKKFDYKNSLKNIEKFREINSTEKNIDRLIKFIKSLKK